MSEKQENVVDVEVEVEVHTFHIQRLPYIENWENSTNFDATIICEDGNCRAHKLVLASASPLLAALLDDQFPGEETYYTIPDIKKETMDLLIHLAYTGKIICNGPQLELVKEAMKYLGFIQLQCCTITESRESQETEKSQDDTQGSQKEESTQESIKEKVSDNEVNNLNEQNEDNNNNNNNNNNNTPPVNEAQNNIPPIDEVQNNENKPNNPSQVDENSQEEDKEEADVVLSLESNHSNHSHKFSSYDSFDEAIRNNDFDEAVGRSLMGIVPDKVTSNTPQNTTNTTVKTNLDSSSILNNNTKASVSGLNSKEEGESSKASTSSNKTRGSQKSKDNSQKLKIKTLSKKRSCKRDNNNSQSSSSSSSSNTMTDSQKDVEKKPMRKTRLSRNNSPLKKTNDMTVQLSIKSSPRLQAKINKNTLVGPVAGTSSNATANIDSTKDGDVSSNQGASTTNNTTVNSMGINDSPIMEGFEEGLDEEELRWIDSVEKSNSLFINQSQSKVNLKNLNLDGKTDKKKNSSKTDEIEDENLNEDESKHNQQGMNNTDTKTSSMTDPINVVTREKENDIEIKTKSQEKRTTNKQSSSSLRPSLKRTASPSLSGDSSTGTEAPESKKVRLTRNSKLEKEKPTRASTRLNKTKGD